MKKGVFVFILLIAFSSLVSAQVSHPIYKQEIKEITPSSQEGVEMEPEQRIINIGTTNYYYYGSGLIAKEENGEIKYYHKDNLGSTNVITDYQGNKIEEINYLPYGSSLSSSDETFTFSGKELDSSGLQYFGARYYDPNLGRFITTDPVTSDINLYSYSNNNPMKYTDPTGMKAVSYFGRPEIEIGLTTELNMRSIYQSAESRLGQSIDTSLQDTAAFLNRRANSHKALYQREDAWGPYKYRMPLKKDYYNYIEIFLGHDDPEVRRGIAGVNNDVADRINSWFEFPVLKLTPELTSLLSNRPTEYELAFFTGHLIRESDLFRNYDVKIAKTELVVEVIPTMFMFSDKAKRATEEGFIVIISSPLTGEHVIYNGEAIKIEDYISRVEKERSIEKGEMAGVYSTAKLSIQESEPIEKL